MLVEVEVVGEAHDGREALNKARALAPDLVLLDIVLARLSGFEVAKTMRTWRHPPRIVFLSMHDNAAYRSAASDLGVQGFVGKADLMTDLMPLIAACHAAVTPLAQHGTDLMIDLMPLIAALGDDDGGNQGGDRA